MLLLFATIHLIKLQCLRESSTQLLVHRSIFRYFNWWVCYICAMSEILRFSTIVYSKIIHLMPSTGISLKIPAYRTASKHRFSRKLRRKHSVRAKTLYHRSYMSASSTYTDSSQTGKRTLGNKRQSRSPIDTLKKNVIYSHWQLRTCSICAWFYLCQYRQPATTTIRIFRREVAEQRVNRPVQFTEMILVWFTGTVK